MPFNSFFMGGFECSTHRDAVGRRLDLIASTRHDEFAEQDYQRLRNINITCCRDGLRWHLIETEPFRYDFASVKNQIAAIRKTGVHVVWDFFHYGFPDDVDIFGEYFIERFAAFSRAAAEFLTSELGGNLFACPVNEISFFSWAAGEVGRFYPCVRRRGNELKRQLVRASTAATCAIKSVSPASVFIATDPAIHVVSKSGSQDRLLAAERYRLAQFEAFDMLIGRKYPELGGSPDLVDVIGLNYYFHNQWHFPNRVKIARGNDLYRPLSEILVEYHERYDKPILIAETGIEDDERPSWFRYVCEQAAIAERRGADINGICLYPIVNHPGWADDRHCRNGLWDYCDENGHREIYEPLASEIRYQLSLLGRTSAA